MKFELPMLSQAIRKFLSLLKLIPMGDGSQFVFHAHRPQGWAPTKKNDHSGA